MPNVRLPRDILKQFLPNHQAIRAFEQVLEQISGTLPTTIEEANNNAGIAIAAANAALSAFNDLAREVMTLTNAPLPLPTPGDDDAAPRFGMTPEYSDIVMRYEPMGQDDVAPRDELGTMSSQNSDFVEISGGNIDGTAIGLSAKSTGDFTTISATGQITSTLAAGTAPFVVASDTVVANLNVSKLLGKTWAIPDPIGATTPSTVAATTITATTSVKIGAATLSAVFEAVGGRSYFASNSSEYAIGVFYSASRETGGQAGYMGATDSATPSIVWSNSSGTRGMELTDAGALILRNRITVTGGATIITTSSALTNGAGAGAGTITNAPAAGNPTKWIGINDNGTTRYIPAW